MTSLTACASIARLDADCLDSRVLCVGLVARQLEMIHDSFQVAPQFAQVAEIDRRAQRILQGLQGISAIGAGTADALGHIRPAL